MDGHKHEGLSDEALQREIEAVLGVDPSPEFLPQVRARIARERRHDGWLWSAPWRWAGAAAVVTVVAIVGVWTLRGVSPAPQEARNAPPVETTTPSIEPERQAPALVASGADRPKSVRVPVVRAVRVAPRPEAVAPFDVMIAADEAAALKQLFTAISNHRIETRALPDLASAMKPPAPIEEIVLDPITISPLAALEGE
jgi:hypothetical protein